MKSIDPDATFKLTLPNGERVVCWKKQTAQIRADVLRTGTVVLIKDPDTGVHERVDPGRVRP